jgi:hypothetical protein
MRHCNTRHGWLEHSLTFIHLRLWRPHYQRLIGVLPDAKTVRQHCSSTANADWYYGKIRLAQGNFRSGYKGWTYNVPLIQP